MMPSFQVFLVLVTLTAISAFPFSKPEEEFEPFDNSNATVEFEPEEDITRIREGYFLHGDLILPENFFTEGATIVDMSKRWYGSTVPYVIDNSLKKWESMILNAMKEYHTKTCIKFVKRNAEKNYVYLTAGQGCNSYLGMVGGKQVLNLQANACTYLGTAIHELGHAIGLHHEHQRSDRDSWITVFMNNVEAGAASQFTKLKDSENKIPYAYDLDSIMHYGENAFSKDGVSKTMTAKNGKKLLNPYDKKILTDNDVKTIKWLYGCKQ